MPCVSYSIPRRARLRALLRRRKFHAISELKRATGTPHATLHRDLTALAHEGLLRKTRGGVEALDASVAIREYDRRVRLHVAQKQAIAQAALVRVQAGDHVFLDASSTCYFLGRALLQRSPDGVTIVTNSLPLMEEYRKRDTAVKVVSTGGSLDRELGACLGNFTVDFLARIRVAKVFMSAAGWSVEAGITTTSDFILGTAKAALALAAERYCLIDSHKYGREHLFSIASLTTFTAVITDAGLEKQALQCLQRAKVALVIGGGG